MSITDLRTGPRPRRQLLDREVDAGIGLFGRTVGALDLAFGRHPDGAVFRDEHRMMPKFGSFQRTAPQGSTRTVLLFSKLKTRSPSAAICANSTVPSALRSPAVHRRRVNLNQSNRHSWRTLPPRSMTRAIAGILAHAPRHKGPPPPPGARDRLRIRLPRSAAIVGPAEEAGLERVDLGTPADRLVGKNLYTAAVRPEVAPTAKIDAKRRARESRSAGPVGRAAGWFRWVSVGAIMHTLCASCPVPSRAGQGAGREAPLRAGAGPDPRRDRWPARRRHEFSRHRLEMRAASSPIESQSCATASGSAFAETFGATIRRLASVEAMCSKAAIQ